MSEDLRNKPGLFYSAFRHQTWDFNFWAAIHHHRQPRFGSYRFYLIVDHTNRSHQSVSNIDMAIASSTLAYTAFEWQETLSYLQLSA
ncbi:MAG: hypothetical protein G5701_07810 [Serratia symbiotica]|nr:hypothetical protein [Serratia symbiotica]